MSFKIEGFDELDKKLTDIIKELPEKRNIVLKQSAENLIGYTKDKTPVDTGNLRMAWTRTQPAGSSIKVYNDTEYSLDVEYGHRQRRRWVPGYWKGNRFVYDSAAKTGMMLKEKFIPGAKMLHKGMEDFKGNFKDDISEVLEDLFE